MVKSKLRLIQPTTEKDFTKRINYFCKEYLDSVGDIDGFILKSRSPTCGIRDVKIFSRIDDKSAVRKGGGFFGTAALERFPRLPVEDENRLRSSKVREYFLKKIFTPARLRGVKNQEEMKETFWRPYPESLLDSSDSGKDHN